jgi:hypothetical protein
MEGPLPGELYTEYVSAGVRRPVRAEGLTLQLRETRKNNYIPCKMTTNNGKVLLEKPDAWGYGVSSDERQARFEVYTSALRRLANKGLTAAIAIARFHQRMVLPFFGMTMDAPFKGTRMAAEWLSQEVASQRAIRAVSHPAGSHGDLWRLPMRPGEGRFYALMLMLPSFPDLDPVHRG